MPAAAQPDAPAQLAGGTVVPDPEAFPPEPGHPLRSGDVYALIPKEID